MKKNVYVLSTLGFAIGLVTFAAWYHTDIFGQAFLRTQGGDIKTCAGEPVYLYPDQGSLADIATAYGLQNSLGKTPAEIINPETKLPYPKALAICDAAGNFYFQNPPFGTWIVSTEVNWTGGDYGFDQGGEVIGVVTTAFGVEKRIIVTTLKSSSKN